MSADVDRRLQAIFREVISEDVVLSDELTAAQVEGWDSLAHVTLIYAIEDEFGMEFTQDEMTNMADVGELKRTVRAKLGAGGA